MNNYDPQRRSVITCDDACHIYRGSFVDSTYPYSSESHIEACIRQLVASPIRCPGSPVLYKELENNCSSFASYDTALYFDTISYQADYSNDDTSRGNGNRYCLPAI